MSQTRPEYKGRVPGRGVEFSTCQQETGARAHPMPCSGSSGEEHVFTMPAPARETGSLTHVARSVAETLFALRLEPGDCLAIGRGALEQPFGFPIRDGVYQGIHLRHERRLREWLQ
jgi:hypothetical protein